jgi:hypothetical protein
VILKIFSKSSFEKAQLSPAQAKEIDDSAINVTQWWLILRRLKQLSELKSSSMKKVQLWLKQMVQD